MIKNKCCKTCKYQLKVLTCHYYLTNQIVDIMNITFEELRQIKHQLPTGSIKKIADELHIDEQAVRNYFGANKYTSPDGIVDRHIQGGIVHLEDTRILEIANRIIKETQLEHLQMNN